MTEQTTETADESIDITLSCTFHEQGNLQVQHLAHGLSPNVLLALEPNEGALGIELDATGFLEGGEPNTAPLVDLLRTVADALERNGGEPDS